MFFWRHELDISLTDSSIRVHIVDVLQHILKHFDYSFLYVLLVDKITDIPNEMGHWDLDFHSLEVVVRGMQPMTSAIKNTRRNNSSSDVKVDWWGLRVNEKSLAQQVERVSSSATV